MAVTFQKAKKPVETVTGKVVTTTPLTVAVPTTEAANDTVTPAASEVLVTQPSWKYQPDPTFPPGDETGLLKIACLEYLDAKYPETWEKNAQLAAYASVPLPIINQFLKFRGHSDFTNKQQVTALYMEATSAHGKHQYAGRLVYYAVKEGFTPEAAAKPNLFKFHSGDEYALDFIGDPELVEDVLPARGVAMVYGMGGSGKTFWMLDLAFHVHNGEQWRDKDVSKGDVFYVAAEAGRGIKKRIQGVRKQHPDWHAPYVADMAPNLSKPESVQAVVDAVRSVPDAKPALVVIDTLSASFEGDDSAQKDTAVVLRNLKTLADGLECAVVFVHHTVKTGDSWRGSGVLSFDSDVVIEITSDGQEEHHGHMAKMVKLREGQGGTCYGFKLRKTVPLAQKANGKFIDTCTVVQTEDTCGGVIEKVPSSIAFLREVYAKEIINGKVTVDSLLQAAGQKQGAGFVKANYKKALAKHLGYSGASQLPDGLVLGTEFIAGLHPS